MHRQQKSQPKTKSREIKKSEHLPKNATQGIAHVPLDLRNFLGGGEWLFFRIHKKRKVLQIAKDTHFDSMGVVAQDIQEYGNSLDHRAQHTLVMFLAPP